MSADMRSQAHFRLLDLPCELRLMVYKWLQVMTTVYSFQYVAVAKQTTRERTESDSQNVPTVVKEGAVHNFRGLVQASSRLPPVTVVLKSFSSFILQTCKSIYGEATPIIATRLSQLEREPVRIMLDLAKLQEDSIKPGKTLEPISEMCMPVLKHTSRIRQAPSEEPHIVFTFVNSKQGDVEPVRLAATILIPIFVVAHRQGAFCTVLCEEQATIPQFRTYEAILTAVKNHPESPLSGDQKMEIHLRLKELNEEEWAKHRAMWERWL